MQELDHYRARANDLQKAQEEQLSEIARIPKELESLEFVGLLMSLGSALPDLSALSADHVRTVLICPKSHSDSSISVQTESILKGRPTDLFYFVMLIVPFTFAGARRIERKIRSRGVSAVR